MQLKAGYNGSTTDALAIAEEANNATVAKNKATLIQAQAQMDAAAINLEAAKNQLSLLAVRSPISGIITQVSVRPGDVAGPQTVAAQIVNPNGFELDVGVNADDVERVIKAEIKIGGKYLEVPIKNISPVADPASKLVNVTLALPNIFFRANQTLDARISFSQPQTAAGTVQTVMIPVDAIVIGDDNGKYVFVDDNGKAKKVAVSVGEIKGDEVAILSGLNENDQVIVRGSQDLTDGQAVALN
jgi:RND family efflux transporter MFP subunit